MTQSSYLMSFIHGLMENSSKEVRERKRRLLERDYTETEEVLNVYLNEKHTDVAKILNAYRDVSENLEKNRKSVQKMKRDIVQCKSLLNCNREELRRLWLEVVEQRRSLELIEILDRVRAAPEILKSLISAKAWPEATVYLLKITDLITKEVDHIPALDAVKTELAARKRTLVDEMRETLFFLVFDQPVALVISDKSLRCNVTSGTQGLQYLNSDFYPSDSQAQQFNGPVAFKNLPLSDWRSLCVDPPEVDSSLFKDPQSFTTSLLTKRFGVVTLGASKQTKSKAIRQPYGGIDKIRELIDRVITERKQWADTIVALTHCLHRLGKLTQAFSSWRGKVHSGKATGDLPSASGSKLSRTAHEMLTPGQDLQAEIHNSITIPAVLEIERTLAAQGETAPPSSLADSTHLVDLLRILFPSLCMHFNSFMLVLRTTKKIKEQNPGVSFDFLDLLSEQHIWTCIQTEVQMVLSSHLSNQNLSLDTLSPSLLLTTLPRANATNFNSNKLDLNALFAKRRAALPSFLSGATNDPSGSQNGGGGSSADGIVTSSSIGGDPGTFFSFAKTAHSLSVNSYLRENRINMTLDYPSAVDSVANKPPTTKVDRGQAEAPRAYPVVCRASTDNVKSVYSLVLAFARVIEVYVVSAQTAVERALSHRESETTAVISNRGLPPAAPSKSSRAGSGSASIALGLKGALMAIGAQKMLPKTLTVRCQLRAFLLNFIERLYLPNAEVELRGPLLVAISGHDVLTAIVSQNLQRDLGLQRPILLVVYMANQALCETKGMVIALPEYAINCAKIGLTILETFNLWGLSAYRSLSVCETTGTMSPSAEWAIDRDLSRFWTKFPVWQRMSAADAFSVVNANHPHDSLPAVVNREKNSSVFGNLRLSSVSAGSNFSSAAAIVLGISGCSASATGGAVPGFKVTPFAGSFGQDVGMVESQTAVRTTESSTPCEGISKQAYMLLHEREATRLAAKEMDKLIHMIHNEVGSGSELCLPTLNLLAVKSMGRLRVSTHWLERCVHNWLTWLESEVPDLQMAPFTAAAEELSALSDACILTIYLDVRVQAYNLLFNLPRTSNFWCPVDEVDVDPEVTRCLVYWDQLQEVLIHSCCPHELRFIFDGLGDFISQIFLRLIPNFPRMNANGNRKMCRNIYKLQQALALLTENRESDLIRVKQLYELFYLTPEAVVNRIIEQGVAFDIRVYQDLLRLYQRSHPSHDHSKTDESIVKLTHVIRA